MPERKEMTEQIDWRAKQLTLTGGLLLGRSEVLRSLIHNLRTQTKDITSSITRRREVWKEEALDDLPLKGQERVIVSQTNIGIVSKATWENF